jgi:thiamine biosynthesis lipoprotein
MTAARTSELVVARRAMACEFSITFPAGTRHGVEAGCAALDEVDRLEELLSVFRESSAISRLNADQGGSVDPEVYHLLHWSSRLTAATGGAFDSATGALVRLWREGRVPRPAEVEAALARCGSRHLAFHDGAIEFLRPGLQINLGAIGKGYAIDAALRRIRPRSALMQGGRSSIAAVGEWTVEIGEPAFVRVRLRNQAMGTSATTYQPRHILDPRTGWPARAGVLSATAVAPTATEADALSTAFYVLGPAATRRFCEGNPRFGAVLLLPGNRLEIFGNVEAIP